MKILAISYPKKPEDEQKIARLVFEYRKSIEPKMLAEMFKISFPDLPDAIEKHEDVHVPFCRQFLTLLARNAIAVWRNPASLLWRVFMAVFISLNELASFWKVGNDFT